jgi:hypothetical protein
MVTHSMHSSWLDINRQLKGGLEDVSAIISVIEFLLIRMYLRASITDTKLRESNAELVIRTALDVVKSSDIEEISRYACQIKESLPTPMVMELERRIVREFIRLCEHLYSDGRYHVLTRLVAFVSALAEDE